ncbi:sigma-E factor negative regulatory protein RseA [Dyella sp. SG562]|uniref:sigma-E factor negative regulatory protein n=2 Tax=Rhodanobacteraceae TaxID=1775411 RepID=UPI001422A86F|nr:MULTISPECIES: sigma-E factor negative regulatory protein [unclassified Dyella]NII73685.1 sigma-E factor negative regulatory protein RseA [Dyella sp. SG562]NKJ20688.1 sigma-E factor negative regulatory protein RseA [Dyella sp. SG609]
MTDNHREHPSQGMLSAGIDGELTQEELRFLLRRLDHDAALQQAWSRYHVARDGLRHQLPPLASAGFSARVLVAIEQETIAVGSGRRRHWLRWSAGGAIAATVAVAALMVTQPVGPGSDNATPRVATAGSQRAAVTQSAATATARADVPAAAPEWLNNYAGLPSALTQQASATVGGDDGATFLYSRNRQNPYQLDRYRAINNGDGSYLLLAPQVQQRIPQAQSAQEPQAQ